MTPFAAPVNEASFFKLRDEFSYLGRHTIILILLRDARYSLCSRVYLSTRVLIGLGVRLFQGKRFRQ